MATARINRLSRFGVVLAAGSVAVAGIAVGLPNSSAASPAPTIHQVETRIAAINHQAEVITESYDAAHTTLTSLRGKAAAAHTTLSKDEKVLESMQGSIGRMAAAAYETEGLSGATQLLGEGSPQVVIDKASDLGQVARSRSDELSRALVANRAVQVDQATYNAQIAAESKTVAAIASKQGQIKSLLSKETAELDSLKASQRRELARQAQEAREQAISQRSTYHAPAAPAVSSQKYAGPATGSAAAAIQFAYAQLGKPYVYGGAGPDSYDCSGLTMRSWGAGGVSLPHNAAAQQAEIPAVSLSDLQPGDLVFFGDPAYHVAIYIGGGRIIQAPHTGAYVEISSLAYQPPTSAGRP